ncbi:MAG TPA: tyrosine-type recombinase/integrase [Mesorhizobium sp.]|nr:tyrosine-type recombinase/integrase [Mesorhizobium sp.]
MTAPRLRPVSPETTRRRSPRTSYCILTATRANETLGATWAEVDLRQRQWIIPSARMKASKEHRIPLAPAAVELLAALPRVGDSVFGSALYSEAMLRLAQRSGS